LKDRLSLEQRLKELAETECSVQKTMGAMCYEMMPPVEKDYICPGCGYKFKLTDWTIGEIEGIKRLVEQIKDAGYDVVLDECCGRCGIDKFIYRDTVHLIFKIRYSPDSEYHIAESNNLTDYQCVLDFLKGDNFYRDERDDVNPLNRHIAILQKMLGIGNDIIPPKNNDIAEDEMFL
jgi:hypothetical protein